jgi:hypothetical protein
VVGPVPDNLPCSPPTPFILRSPHHIVYMNVITVSYAVDGYVTLVVILMHYQRHWSSLADRLTSPDCCVHVKGNAVAVLCGNLVQLYSLRGSTRTLPVDGDPGRVINISTPNFLRIFFRWQVGTVPVNAIMLVNQRLINPQSH